jgi:hypothetical protein
MIGPLAGLGTGIGPAFGVFLAGAALLCVLGWTVAAALHLVSRRSA